ncbi:MAG TPA: MFS transporter [Methylomirabilota bacterium]|nr:MFS transporter [Methylomirabilota bacterium]
MQDLPPPWIKAVTTPGAMVFAVLFALESLARATLWTIVPLQAYALLADVRDVSLLNTGVSLFGMIGGLTMPLLIRALRRRWVYTLGVVMAAVAGMLLATGTLPGQIAGMLARSFGGAATNITLMLYVMDYIRKKDLVHSEPLRMRLSAAAWASGPFLGVFLNEQFGRGTGETVTVVSAVLLLVYFWYLRIQDNPAVAAATHPPPNPFQSIARFLSQPRLRLAWIIPFGRSCWWSMFAVYPPIYMVNHFGERPGQLLGALLVSAGNGLLFGAPVAGRLAARFGLRRPIIGALLGMGLLTILAGLLYDWPLAVIVCVLAAAAGAVTLDSLGGIPFMRSVHPYERPQMTAVFRTYIDLSDLLPAAFFSLILSHFDMRAVFLAMGLFAFGVAAVARHLPRGM